MNQQEAAALLGIAAAFDNRKPDPDAAKAWAVALEGLPFGDCRDAVIAHYRKTNDWLMPAHVIGEVKRVRADRLSHTDMPSPPQGAADDPAVYSRWYRETRLSIMNGTYEPPATPELTRRNMRELTQARHVDTA
ncbi:MAG: hypothetical protein CMJ18_07635 [Phycisphaeraceae bacterium]|nr:hypothetical protein [Phycisphaeraceae bacterium]